MADGISIAVMGINMFFWRCAGSRITARLFWRGTGTAYPAGSGDIFPFRKHVCLRRHITHRADIGWGSVWCTGRGRLGDIAPNKDRNMSRFRLEAIRNSRRHQRRAEAKTLRERRTAGIIGWSRKMVMRCCCLWIPETVNYLWPPVSLQSGFSWVIPGKLS